MHHCYCNRTDAWYVNRIVGFLGPERHQLLVEDPRCQRAHALEGLREVDLDLLDFVYLDRPARCGVSPLRPSATQPVVAVLPPMEAAAAW